MCFSAIASFTMGALLFSTGVFSATTAYKCNKYYLFFSLIPIFFAIQQCIEGLIWWQLHTGILSFISIYAYIYLFFALCFWPSYVPFCVYRIEKNLVRKKIMHTFMSAGLILGLVIYIPILLGFIPLVTAIVGDSIHYEAYPWGPLIWTYTFFYALILIVPLLLSSVQKIKIFGIMTFISGLVAYWWYISSFISIWCFFAAILSFYVVYAVYKLSTRADLS